MDAPSPPPPPPPSLQPFNSDPSLPANQTNTVDNERAVSTTITTTVNSTASPSNPFPRDEIPEKPICRNKPKAKKRVLRDASASSSSSSGWSSRGTRVAGKRRNPKVVLSAPRRNPNSDEIAFRLGMSFAAFVAQILERNGEQGGGMSSDKLAKICASAVRESLANDFGNTVDCFIRNFEDSFGSTLRTLKSIKESSTRSRSHQNMEGSSLYVTDDEQDDSIRGEGCTSSSDIEDCHSEAMPHINATQGQINYIDEVNRNMLTMSSNLDITLHGQTNQLTNQSVLRTVQKSVMEQARANDLKTVELKLKMESISLKQKELALNHSSHELQRLKFDMGKLKASFNIWKFATKLEDTRHAELLRKCIDCLVAGLLVMAASLLYGTYVYSYKRLSEATASCTPSTKGSKSWMSLEAWDPMSSFNSGFQVLWCKLKVVSRMLFGVLMIVAIAVLLLQRSGTAKQTMPATYIVLLLGIGCGILGKLCVDTLGGSGYHWVIYWETFCTLHFLCNVWTSYLFFILHGPVDASQGTKRNAIIPYWTRRLVLYGTLFLFLPLFCGLLPFASLGEWRDHFLLVAADLGYL